MCRGLTESDSPSAMLFLLIACVVCFGFCGVFYGACCWLYVGLEFLRFVVAGGSTGVGV